MAVETPRVLIVTGTMLAVDEGSVWRALARQLASMRASSGPWLDLRLKLLAVRELLAQRALRRRGGAWSATVDRLFTDDAPATPELTEVVLATLLEARGLPWEATTWARLASDRVECSRLLDRCSVVFASTTLLRDLSELQPLVALLRRPGNRIVVGGALAPLLPPTWPGSPHIDVLAVGEGERLLDSLADWVRGAPLRPPPGGNVRRVGVTQVVTAGPSPSRSLDDLPRPDWRLAERYHGRPLEHVYYESVRGCPYRCSFCNYPYLFADTRFRTKSASRIADDWEAYARAGVKTITCLDSLFTVPPKRLDELCALLVERDLDLEWICYARADDLTDPARVQRMRAAGCIQVQIGIESGDPGQLKRMDKRCDVEQGKAAIALCREHGITTLCTFIVGFPGETASSLQATLDFVLEAQPDFYYLAPFTTRVLGVPILSEASRAEHAIETSQGISSSAPYWRHATMSCADLAAPLESLNRQIVQAGASLDATLFYLATRRYRPADKPDLLAFQREAAQASPWLRRGLTRLGRWVQTRLERDQERVLTRGQPPAGTMSTSRRAGVGR
ncbi:MAG: radical SAM protein [Myxococcales bacterium]|nr:radical SAM protein [Myxococcales bacterium]